MANGNLFEVHAREKANLPENWKMFRWAALPPGETIYYELEGGVFLHVKKRGKYKGRTDYSKPEEGTLKTVRFTVQEHKAWVEGWEERTGKCRDCMGTGQTLASISRDGTTWRKCFRCKATGNCPVEGT